MSEYDEIEQDRLHDAHVTALEAREVAADLRQDDEVDWPEEEPERAMLIPVKLIFGKTDRVVLCPEGEDEDGFLIRGTGRPWSHRPEMTSAHWYDNAVRGEGELELTVAEYDALMAAS